MHKASDWPAVWQELRDNLAHQPPCPEHPEYPCVRTLAQGLINDIINVGENGIIVRSHRTLREDYIEASRFQTWWNHLVSKGSARLAPGAPNNPHRWRSRIVGAIMGTCLPNRIRVVGTGAIELVE